MRDEIRSRIKALSKKANHDALIIIDGASHKLRNHDVTYTFYQSSDFMYLSGWLQPNARLLIYVGDDVQSTLFCEPSNAEIERWEGVRLSPDEILAKGHADKVLTTDEYDAHLKKLLTKAKHIYFPFSAFDQYNDLISNYLNEIAGKRVSRITPTINDLNTLVGPLRLIKSNQEIERMRHAAEISAKAHMMLMQEAKAGLKEYQLAADFEYYCKYHGCPHLAYDSIVASGKNACILHYTSTLDTLKEGDLILVDAGGEYQGYASDISRTFPVSGRFSEAQKSLYNVVLDAQSQVIKAIKPGVTIPYLQSVAKKYLFEGLKALGMIQNFKESHISHYYFHGVSHWLGLDVHDACPYLGEDEKPLVLEPGMTLTVEPGLYFGDHLDTVHSDFHHLGIRIEDDIVVTEDGADVLSKDCPKQTHEIEEIMSV